MKTPATILGLFFVFYSFSAIYPTSDDGGVIGGAVCIGCSVENPELARDGDVSTYANYELTAGTLTYGYTVFSYASDIPSSTIITITASYPDLPSNTFGALASLAIFQNTEIVLLDEFDNIIFEYTSNNLSTVEVLDDTQNLVEIKIINSYSGVRKIGVRAGGILSVVGDVRIYEVEYEIGDFLFASQNVTFGYFDGASLASVDINHAVNNPDFATYDNSLDFYDVNSAYTSFEYLLSVNLGTEYLYASYNWGGAYHSGLTNDLFILLEDADLLSVSDIKLLYDSDKIAIKVTYSDDSFELLDSSNPLLSADVLALGSGRFYLRADLDDTKLIKEVEVRFSPFVNAISELKLYSVFLRNAGTSTPLPVEFLGLEVTVFETDVDISWSTLSELNNDYFKLIQLNSAYEIVDEFIIEGKGNSINLEEYFMTIRGLQNGIHYFSIYQYDVNSDEEYLETEAVLIDAESNIKVSVFPNPTSSALFIQDENNNEEYTFELVDTNRDTFKKEMSYGGNDLSDEIPGTYYLKISSAESVQYQRIIIVE